MMTNQEQSGQDRPRQVSWDEAERAFPESSTTTHDICDVLLLGEYPTPLGTETIAGRRRLLGVETTGRVLVWDERTRLWTTLWHMTWYTSARSSDEPAWSSAWLVVRQQYSPAWLAAETSGSNRIAWRAAQSAALSAELDRVAHPTMHRCASVTHYGHRLLQCELDEDHSNIHVAGTIGTGEIAWYLSPLDELRGMSLLASLFRRSCITSPSSGSVVAFRSVAVRKHRPDKLQNEGSVFGARPIHA